MRNINIEFPYFHKEFGQEVIVEVEAVMYKGIGKGAASDWDVEDYLDIFNVEVFYERELLSIDIPDQVIYSEISAKIRDAQMTVAFSEEDGGF